MPRYKPDPRHVARPPERYCNGKVKNRVSADEGEEAYCHRGAGWGTDHPGLGRCKHHGGSAPTYIAELEKVKAQMEMSAADRAIAQYGLPTEIDPHEALLQELYRTQGHVEWLRIRVGEIETDDMVGPVGGGQGGYPSYEPSVWIKMYRDERAHLKAVAKTCIDAGISERRVKIAEQQAVLFAAALESILKRLGVADHPDAPSIVRQELLKLETGDGSDSYGNAGALDVTPVEVG